MLVRIGVVIDQIRNRCRLLVFVRILPAMDTTGTFKMRKMDLIADGYDPAKVKGPLFFHDPKRGYVKVTKVVYERIATGLVKV